MQKTTNYKLGGLGANTGGKDWIQKMSKAEKAKEYADMIKDINSKTISMQKPPKNPKKESVEISTREKAMKFAKTIKRPKVKKAIGDRDSQGEKNDAGQNDIDIEIGLLEGDLESLEREHLNFKTKIQSMKEGK